MKFISKYAKFGFNASPGTQKWVTDSSGNSRQVDNNDGIYLQFAPGGLTLDEQQAALEQLTRVNALHPFGATPKMNDDVISAQEALAEGEAHNAHDGFSPYQRLGRFDTEDPTQCPARIKDAAEAALLAANEFGHDLFRIDNYNLVPPWPTYPEAANAKLEGVLAYAKQGGLDFRQILRYEKATTARKAWITAFEKEIEEADQAAREEDALAIK